MQKVKTYLHLWPKAKDNF